MRKTLVMAVALLSIVAGCSKEDFGSSVPVGNGEIKSVSARIAEPTKAYLNYDLKQQCWQTGDFISIYTKSCPNSKFEFAGTDGETVGTFSSGLGINDTTVYYAVYPYDAVTGCIFKSKGDTLLVTYPSKQTMESDGLAEGANLMAAKSTNKDEKGEPVFYFQNTCAYLDMTVNGPEDDMIESIIIKSADGRAINGGASIFWTDGNPSTVFDGTGTDTNVIICKDGFPFAQPFDIAVPPFDGGFSITIITVNGLEQTRTSSNDIKPNSFIEMPEFEFSAAASCCKIGEDEYPSFKAALAAANESISDCTITLTADCHVAGTAGVTNSDCTVTLDLNGHVLTAVESSHLFVSEDAKGFTIKDSDAEGKGTILQADNTAACVESNGNLTIESGNIVSQNRTVVINGGNFTMLGGRIKGESTAGALYAKIPNASYEIESITIEGGSIESDTGYGFYINGCDGVTINDCHIITEKPSLYCYSGKVEINGGVFVSNSNTIYIGASAYADIKDCHVYTKAATFAIIVNKTDGNTKITGGYFSKTVPAATIANGYFASPCEETFEGLNYTYKIEKKATVEATIKVGDKEPVERATVMEALKEAASANEDCIVTLQSNCQMTEKIEIDSKNKITIDLNGFTLVSQSGNRLEIIGDDADVTVKSSVEGGAIEQNATGAYVINMTKGTFTLESGEIRSAANATTYTLYIKGGSVNIKGGRIYGECYRSFFANGAIDFNMSGGEIAGKNTTEGKSGNQLNYFGEGANIHISGGKLCNTYFASTLAGCEFDEGSRISIDTLTVGYSNFEIKKGSFGPMVISSGTGIESRISGGTFTATGKETALATTGAGSTSISGGTFAAENGIALDIQKGTANVSGGTFTSKYMGIRTSATANLSGNAEVNVAGEPDSHVYGLYLGSSAFGSSNASFTISGGKYTSAWRLMHRYGGNFSITDGTFIAGEQVIAGGKAGSPVLEVWGGNFSTSCDTTGIFEGDNFKTGVVAGGRYSKAIPEDFLKSGYSLKEEATTIEGISYTYKVEEAASGDAASVNGTPYAKFSDAVAAANASDGTITLLRDNTFKEDANITGIVTLDLAGYKIDEGASCFNVKSGAQFTLIDGVGEGAVEGQGDYAIYTKGGKVIINSGSITNAKMDAIYADAGSTIEVNGGKVTAKDSSAIVLYQSKCLVSGTAEIQSSMKVQASKAVQKTDAHLGAIAVIQSELEVTGGQIINDAAIGVYSYGSSTNPCTVEISGGEIEGRFHGIYPYYRSVINISGGSVEETYPTTSSTSTSACIYTNMTASVGVAVNISGGLFKSVSPNTLKSAGESSGKVFNITGGKFNITPVNDKNIKLPAGYSVKGIDEGDYKFEVVKD